MAVDLNQAISDRIKTDLQMQSTPEQAFGKLKLPTDYSPQSGVMSDAIKNKAYQKFYDPETIKDMQIFKTVKSQSNQAQNLSNQAQGVSNLTRQQMELARKRVDDEKKQRAAVMGQVLGIGGMIAGGMIGGPAGAYVGSQVGNSVGQGVNNG